MHSFYLLFLFSLRVVASLPLSEPNAKYCHSHNIPLKTRFSAAILSPSRMHGMFGSML